MKNVITYLKALWGAWGNLQSTDVSLDCRLTVGSPSGLDAKWKQNPFMRIAVVLTLIFTIGIGNVWGADYNLVSNVGDLSAGDIVVIATAAGQTATTTESTNASKNAYWFTYVNSTMNGDATKITSLGSGAAEYTLSKSGSYWIFTCSSGDIGSVSEKKLRYGTGTNTWTISISDNNASIASTDDASRKIYFANGDRFRTYTTAQTAIRLYKKASACANSVNISKGTGTNCTFSLSPSGSQASCSGVTTTVSITPTSGYGTPVVTQSGASKTPTISGSGNSQTVTYAANTTGTSTINVTCSANTYTITLDKDLTPTTTGTASITATYNSSDNLTSAITTPTKTGWTFAGYYTAKNGGGTQIIDADGNVLASKAGYTDASKNWIGTSDVTLYAKWTCTVTWSVNGLTNVYSAHTLTYNGTSTKVASIPGPPSPATYCGDKFMGWTTESDVSQDDDTGLNLFTNVAGSPELKTVGNTTFYAVFADYAE